MRSKNGYQTICHCEMTKMFSKEHGKFDKKRKQESFHTREDHALNINLGV